MGNESSSTGTEDYHPGRRFYTMYHGTTMETAQNIKHEGFRPSSDGMLGPGVYVSRSFDKAARYPLTDRHKDLAILKLRVRVGKVKKIDYQGHPLQKSWHQNGYDCAWVPPNCGMVPSGLEEDCSVQESIHFVCYFQRISLIFSTMGNKSSTSNKKTHPGRRFYTMYHGTTMETAQKIKREGFRPSSDGMLGPGVYVSRSFKKATRYPLTDRHKDLAILKLRVRVGKVKKIDYQGHPLQKSWHQNGYDCAWVPPNCGMVPSGLEEDCVYDPTRIEVLEIIAR
ncbi:hypothetical protein DNTS_026162 [Danionella cerebrum]|uniref:PARP catalytic domain-containing protein n=1 Tax=Danionella cerebrum TaxID=2873325 RepID=A0A553QZX0_9TELE|nr:hypothetical protein DNTS_026162 [Danionella translucida]